MLYLYNTFNSDRHTLGDFVLYSILIHAVRTVSDVLNDNTLAVLSIGGVEMILYQFCNLQNC